MKTIALSFLYKLGAAIKQAFELIKGRDIILLLFSFLLMFYSEALVLYFFPTETALSRGYLYSLAYTCTVFAFTLSFTFLILRVFYTIFYKYMITNFSFDFKNFTPWQKSVFSFACLLFLAILFVWIFTSLNQAPLSL